MENAPIIQPEQDTPSFLSKHRLFLLVSVATAIAILVVVIGLTIYNVSGTAQLDLSRPGYESVSNQVDTETKIDEYSATGSLTKQTVNEFIDLYKAQAEKATAVDAFNGDPLNPDTLFSAGSSSGQ